MSGRIWLFAVVVLVVLIAASGCSSSDTGSPTTKATPAATATSTPTVATAAGAKALAALQATVADLGAVEVSGGAIDRSGAGATHAVGNLRTGAFEASVDMGKGIGEVRMIRQADLTWTTGAPSFWTGLGYTPESARATRGKWVVSPSENIKTLVAMFDPETAIQAVLDLQGSDVVAVGRVRQGKFRGDRELSFGKPGDTQVVTFTSGDRPRLLRIARTRQSATTVLDFVAFPSRVHVTIPRSKDVFVPSS